MYYIGYSKSTPNSSKSSQARPRLGQRESKKKAWISLDSLVRNEPFQGVALTPWGKKSFVAPPIPNWPSHKPRFRFRASGQGITASDYRKGKCIGKSGGGMSGRFS